MQTPSEPETLEDAPTGLTTTLYDLLTALQTVVEPHEDPLVVALVARWLQTGRMTVLDQTTVRRRLRYRARMALCRWGFHPPLIDTQAFPSGNRGAQGPTIHAAPPEESARTLATLRPPALSS